MISLTDEQFHATKLIKAWFYGKTKRVPFILAGYAGTGKSTIISKITEELSLNESQIRYVSFTGKASLVMRKKGLPATTIHSLIYEPREHQKIVYFEKRRYLDPGISLIIVDESSMISLELQKDLNSFNIPILYVGDSGQLPPISKDVTNLMISPNFTLQTIHRQALDNPIIYIANEARLGRIIKLGKYGDSVLKTRKMEFEIMQNASQLLCGKNVTRQQINKQMREGNEKYGIFPVIGDKLICLKNNNKNGLVNGMIGTCSLFRLKESKIDFLSDEDEKFYDLTVEKNVFLGKPVVYDKKKECFDFGYCITVHKAQGSEFDRVIVFEERFGDKDFHAKWLYTAITRASNKLIIVEN